LLKELLNKIICMDVMKYLSKLPDECVQMCITSPPYWALRDYGTAKWEGGNSECDHTINHYNDNMSPNTNRPYRGNRDKCIKCGAIRIDNQIGLENSPEEYIERLVNIFKEVRRVLKKDGILWLNLGDTYASSAKGSGGPSEFQDSNPGSRFEVRKFNHGLKPKDLVGIPWRTALALQADNWWLRSDIIWAKSNPMPESVKDRPTKSHEYLFMLTKSAQYYYDLEAIREEPKPENDGWMRAPKCGPNRPNIESYANDSGNVTVKKYDVIKGANKRTVWFLPIEPYSGVHTAVFPQALVEPCILAGSKKDDVILDPFMGSGTTALVAIKNERHFLGCDISTKYIKAAYERINNIQVGMNF